MSEAWDRGKLNSIERPIGERERERLPDCVRESEVLD